MVNYYLVFTTCIASAVLMIRIENYPDIVLILNDFPIDDVYVEYLTDQIWFDQSNA